MGKKIRKVYKTAEEIKELAEKENLKISDCGKYVYLNKEETIKLKGGAGYTRSSHDYTFTKCSKNLYEMYSYKKSFAPPYYKMTGQVW